MYSCGRLSPSHLFHALARNSVDRLDVIRQRTEHLRSAVTRVNELVSGWQRELEALDEKETLTRAERRVRADREKGITTAEEKIAEAEVELEGFKEERPRLEAAVAARATWTFDDPRLQIRHDALVRVVEGLERLSGPAMPYAHIL